MKSKRQEIIDNAPGTVEVIAFISINTEYYQLESVRHAINLKILGHEKCNTSKLKSKRMSKKTDKDLQEAHHKMRVGRSYEVAVTIDAKTGEWIDVKLKS